MRGGVLKTKALFMVFLIVTLTFTIHSIAPVSAQQQVCCEETVTGDYCVYTDEAQCDSSGLTAPTSCEQTTFCEPGVCISDIGQCSEAVSKAACEALPDYTWFEGFSNEYDACRQECCVIADGVQASYTTEKHCEFLIQDLVDVELDWRDVNSEAECTAIATSTDRGCCVSADGTCSYDARGACENPEVNFGDGTGFYKNTFCSDIGTCSCLPEVEKRCVGEDVYYFDSCGNQEDLAEDCSLAIGNYCGFDEDIEDYTCQPVTCTTTFDGEYEINGVAEQRNTHDTRIGEERQNGESWCLYESPAGGWFDRPGSQHYRSYCWFGEEIIEPCQDQREEVCLQYPYTLAHDWTIYNVSELENPTPPQTLGNNVNENYDNDFQLAGARCIDNGIYQDLINANVTSVPVGSNLRNTDPATSECVTGNIECPVTYAKETATGEWHCINNCHCLTQEFVDSAAAHCAAQGDCGASLNIVNEYSSEGLVVSRSDSFAGGLDEEGDVKEKRGVYVGYDVNCLAAWAQQGEIGKGLKGCQKFCKENDIAITDEETDDCYFIDSPSGSYEDELEKYGVYGGMFAFSQSVETLLESEVSPGVSTAVALGTSVAITLGGLGILAGILSVTGTSAVTTTAALGGIVGSFTVTSGGGFVSTFLALLPGIAPELSAGAAIPVVGWIAAAVILIGAVVTAIILGGGESTDVVITSTCNAWQPPVGGDNCHLCDTPIVDGGLALNDENGNILQGYECTQYKCESLGQTCQYLSENEGTSRDKCVSSSVNDVNHPIVINYAITGFYSDISTSSIDFAPDNHLIISQELDPFRNFELTLELDEPAICKIDYILPDQSEFSMNYDQMDYYFPDSYYSTTHSDSWITVPAKKHEYHIRCVDNWGNGDTRSPFIVQFTTTEGEEDLSPPLIVGTSLVNGAFVPAGVEETSLTIFLDEPVDECRWSLSDSEFNLMENFFSCPTLPTNPTPLFENECTTTLLVDGSESNNYYFACANLDGNANTQNFQFGLNPTQPLLIDTVAPDGTLFFNFVDLFVTTSEGAENGKAVCSYDGVEFFETDSSTHIQRLEDLLQGDYEYDVSCIDTAGNIAEDEITFTVDTDEDAPDLIELYQIGNTVHYTLDESADCEFFFEEFTFGTGTPVFGSFEITDLTTYYLTCQDTFGNEGSFIIEV